MHPVSEKAGFSPYLTFTRREWSERRDDMPLDLTEVELSGLRGLNDRVSLQEVSEIYLPLSRLLRLYVRAAQGLREAASEFLGTKAKRIPFILGIAGSVAVGKSTTARLLQTLMSRWQDSPRVALVATDGFLYPNSVLEKRGLMSRKGFPESYDVRRLLHFLEDLKSGRSVVTCPVYSHLSYDIVPEEWTVVRDPDIVIVEGLNVLQTGAPGREPRAFVSDYFDFSIYVDAQEDHIRRWYVERFFALRSTAFRDERSYFRRFAELSDNEAEKTAVGIWEAINAKNLRENIAPTRYRATLVLEKGPQHAVQSVKLRR